jgi:Mrp family chromosome partitioning ATPase
MENIPQHCPGVEQPDAGKAAGCQGCPNQKICSTTPKGADPDISLITLAMKTVKKKILILSGKGGVGKSTFAAALAYYLASNKDLQIGLLDLDICGPSIPLLTKVANESVHQSSFGWSPIYPVDNLAVMSIGFLLDSPDDAVIWRGDRRSGMIKQFLRDVDWGEEIDYLIIDTPPGTTDEHLSIVQFLKESGIDGAILISTPQEISLQDVRKEISFCNKVGLKILGMVENMSFFKCKKCENRFEIFKKNPNDIGVSELCKQEGIKFLGRIPINLSLSCMEFRSAIEVQDVFKNAHESFKL